MIQLLSEKEIEFLVKLRALIVEYNAEIYCKEKNNIQIVIDTHLNPDWVNPITFSDCLDESDIDELIEKTQMDTQLIIKKNN